MLPIQRRKYTECVICQKTLGDDSRSEGQLFCHEHRLCKYCSTEITVQESRICFNKFEERLEGEERKAPDYSLIDVECIRCKAIRHEPTIAIRQSEYDYLNLIRLMIIPDMNLSVITNENNAWIQSARLIQNMSLEQKLVHLSMMQSLVGQLEVAVRQDPDWRKDALKDREDKVRRSKPQQEVKHKSTSELEPPPTRRTVQVKEEHKEDEFNLDKFMKDYGLSEREPAKKLFSQIKAAIKGWVRVGSAPELAEKQVIDGLVKSGVLKRVS
jgi:hypothetical protein